MKCVLTAVLVALCGCDDPPPPQAGAIKQCDQMHYYVERHDCYLRAIYHRLNDLSLCVDDHGPPPPPPADPPDTQPRPSPVRKTPLSVTFEADGYRLTVTGFAGSRPDVGRADGGAGR